MRREAFLVFAALVSTRVAAVERPDYRDLRFEEDWSALAAPGALASEDAWDPWKHVALGGGGEVWLSVGGQLRERLEGWHDFGFGAPADDDEAIALSRLRAHADLHVGSHVRVFAEAKSAFTSDPDAFGTGRPGDGDAVALQNGFLEVRGEVADGARATLRLGRQELRFGRQRLVSPLDWGNARRTFDGVTFAVAARGWTLAGFATQPVRVSAYDRNDHVEGSFFSGVHASGSALDGTLRLDLYGYRLDRQHRAIEGSTGDERRTTLGARASSPLGDSGFDVEGEVAAQVGRVGSERLRAFMASAELGYWWRDSRFSPRAYAGLDWASGDHAPGGRVELFDPLFPLGHLYFGAIDAVSRQNLRALTAGVSLRPHARLVVELSYQEFWRDQKSSGLYGASTALLRDGSLASERHIGGELDVVGSFRIDPHQTLGFGFAHFFPGGFVTSSGAGDAIDFGYLVWQYTF